MTLLNGTLAIRDVRDVEAFARKILEKRTRYFGATLSPDRKDEALSFLIATAWELDRSFNEQLGISYSKYLFRMLQLRLVDWYRETYVDARYGALPEEPIAPGEPILDRADGSDWVAEILDFVWLEELVDDATLSDRARRILSTVAIPLMEGGATYEEIGRRLGRSKQWVARSMAELRAELLEHPRGPVTLNVGGG